MYKQIKDFPNYKINKLGKVKNIKTDKFICIRLVNGYKAVNLWKNNKYKTKYIHRLIAKCFLPNPNKLKQINHIDGNRQNNKLSNLEWTNQKQNVNHALKTGLTSLGEKRANSRLTNKQAMEIYKLAVSGKYKRIEIANKFNISVTQVSQIKNKKEWKHIHA